MLIVFRINYPLLIIFFRFLNIVYCDDIAKYKEAGIMAKLLLFKTTSISLILENFMSCYDDATCTFACASACYNKNRLCSESRKFISNRNYFCVVSLPRSTQLWLLCDADIGSRVKSKSFVILIRHSARFAIQVSSKSVFLGFMFSQW